jgi:hypothetical protein
MGRLIAKFPEMIDTTTKVDSFIIRDSVQTQVKQISKNEIDSLLSLFCGSNTIVKDSIVKELVYKTRYENMLPRKSIYNVEEGKITITRENGIEKVFFERWNKKETKEVIPYITPDCPDREKSTWKVFKGWLIVFIIGFISGLLVRFLIKNIIL